MEQPSVSYRRYRQGACGFGQFAAIGLGQHRHVQVGHFRQPQGHLQAALPAAAGQQVGATYHALDAAGGIIDDHRQLVGMQPIATAHHRIATGTDLG